MLLGDDSGEVLDTSMVAGGAYYVRTEEAKQNVAELVKVAPAVAE